MTATWMNLTAAAGLLGLAAIPALAQDVVLSVKPCPAPYIVTPCPTPMAAPATPTTPTDVPIPPAPAPAQAPSVDPLAFGATGGGETFAAASSAVGYIDPALPISQVRLRTDAAYDDNRPERAEFFYMNGGLPKNETSVNYQEVSTYIEYAPTARFSGFVEVPVRFLDPQVNDNHWGLSDINFGAKYAIRYCDSQIITAQLRVYTPTGNPTIGLGTGHASLEPGILAYQRITDRLNLEGEFKVWVPVGGSDFAGNVLRGGIGASYQVYQGPRIRVLPVAEFVGWTVLNGKDTAFPAADESAAGQTIVNAKFGVRTMLGKPVGNGIMSRADVYAGYGRALTGDVWYKDIMRFELRVRY
jgi:hypothetical protein